ncbi:tetratricopeptide repeat protein [Singulisphaera sp. PoT]|uniref:tetratricopeptide repeat protein n=1 Tax=Singulisphaera sp. PoT TaxID=3411797 RepID=UPI003BF47E6F
MMDARRLGASWWFGLVILLGMAAGQVAGQAGGGAEEDDPRQRQVMERFLALIEKTPRRGTALDRVYSYHVERGTIDAFLDAYRARVAKSPDDGNTWFLLGLFEAQRGRDAAAVAALREAERLLPQNPLPSYYLGQALVMVGQPDAAAEAFERAIARKPIRADLLEIFQALGKVHQRARRFEQALAVWNRLEKLLPDDLRVQEQIAQALIDEGQYAEALPRLEGLAKKVKDPHRQVQLAMDAADLKVRLGKTAEALKEFEGLLGRLNPDAWLYREARRRLEDIYLRNDDMAGLSTYYERWIKKTPDDLDAIARLGRLLALQGRSAEAREWLEKAVKLAPTRRELRIALIDQLAKQGLIAEASSQYEALAEREPGNPDTLRDWGRLLLKDSSRPEPDRKAAAAKVWRRMADARKDDAVTVAQVAELFRQADMVDQALELYRKAIALAPESPQYREYLGEYYQALKRTDEAIAAWSEVASGPRRNAKSLARLSEILAGFGHLKPAIEAAKGAIALDPKELPLRIKAASFLGRDGRLKEAIAELDAAARLAETEDEKEEVLRLQIENYQASGTLAAEIASLSQALESGRETGAARWLRLARLWEADRRLPEAAAAVKKALALEPRSVPAWATSARLHESAGDLLSAADGYRRLVQLDRRARGEYLTNIAKLEARLGRRAEALQAGRDLLASAPGNADNYQVFADLCFQLGANDEGLDTLRRSVRLNPSDSKVLLNLAEALARQFRIDEAIEIYWRALAKLDEIEAKLNAVARLADLYLQRNQFDRLIARLGRELGNPDQQRELAFCLAQAYSSAGDYGPARQELERVLATTPRDTQLLKQLSNLAETEGSLADASKYQKQLNDLAPSEEGTSRLAQLYVKSGDMTEAEALWEKISAEDEDSHRVLQAIDSLVGNGKDEAALTITGRLLRARPDDWEALYREGVALVDLDRRDEAERRFQALLALGTSDDALSAIVKARRKNFQPQAASSAWAQAYQARKYPQLYRGYATYSIRQATGLDSRNYYSNASVWSPADFGEARMATMAWRYRLAEKSGRAEAFVKDTREAARNAGRDARPRWDWLYLQMVRDQGKWIYEAARELARNAPDDVDAQWAMLHWLAERTTKPGGGTYRPTGVGVVETTPPLPAEEVDLILKGYRTLRLRKPEIVYSEILASIDTELKRALRDKDREQLYRDALAAVVDPGSLGSALQLAAERGDVDRALDLFDRFDQANPAQATIAYAFLYGSGDPLGRLMNARAQEKAHGDVTRILDHYARVMQQRTPQARRSRNLSPVNSRSYYYIWVGKNQNFTNIDFPKPNDHVDHDGIQLLRNAFELCRRDGKFPDLLEHLGRVAEKGTEIERIDARLMLGYLRWWNEERDLAVKELAEAVKIRPSDPELKLSLAEIREKNDEPAEALKLVDSAEPLDQRMMQRRELLALRLSVLAGDIERARKAAERLFGLRLDVSIQSQLADQMDQLGMHELAEAILGRARRRAGNGTAALVSLMQQYQRQNRTDLAVQVALQLLRRGGSSGFNPYASFYATEEETARKEAIGTLARAGRLKAMIERLEAQVKTSPGSLPLLQNLAEYYRVDGKSAQAREVYKQILAIRPDDAKIRFQIASQLLDDGEIEATLDHFRVVLKKEPSLFRYRSDDIFKAFRQAQRLDELVSLLEQVDFKTFGHPAFITPMIAELFKEKEPRLHDAALRLVRKAMDAFPNERMYVLGQVKDEAIWGLPEMLDYARTAVLPPADDSLDAIWHGLDEVIEYADDGRLIGVATRLLEVAASRNALRPLLGDIEAASKPPAGLEGGAGPRRGDPRPPGRARPSPLAPEPDHRRPQGADGAVHRADPRPGAGGPRRLAPDGHLHARAGDPRERRGDLAILRDPRRAPPDPALRAQRPARRGQGLAPQARESEGHALHRGHHQHPHRLLERDPRRPDAPRRVAPDRGRLDLSTHARRPRGARGAPGLLPQRLHGRRPRRHPRPRVPGAPRCRPRQGRSAHLASLPGGDPLAPRPEGGREGPPEALRGGRRAPVHLRPDAERPAESARTGQALEPARGPVRQGRSPSADVHPQGPGEAQGRGPRRPLAPDRRRARRPRRRRRRGGQADARCPVRLARPPPPGADPRRRAREHQTAGRRLAAGRALARGPSARRA